MNQTLTEQSDVSAASRPSAIALTLPLGVAPDVTRDRATDYSFTIPSAVRTTKRVIDVFAALCGLLVTMALLPIIAIAIYVDSPGPIFYRQRRAAGPCARNARGHCKVVDFEMMKFRTMRIDAEKVTGAVLAGENDPRVTRVGRIMRKTRLDELPQFWTVLVGDMSLVGPRPERPEIFENLALGIPFFEERMRDCKPGITGLAQVSLGYTGRAPVGSPVAEMADCLTNPLKLEKAEGSEADDMRTKLLFDLAYVAALEHFQTFAFMELMIILKTPLAMLRGLGR
jgi:lipopolysaccharide/colanic/teichoic acid biosynthesis glycosyltransferase